MNIALQWILNFVDFCFEMITKIANHLNNENSTNIDEATEHKQVNTIGSVH